ncbi:MAG TPA: hypothetical protein VJ779_03770 [Acetobacteraceae bacterium]|nr:hypothetical protein [Acetobacteraceae bacterium]
MRKTVLATALLTAIGGGVALAQGGPPGSPSWQDTVIMIAPNGSVMQKKITDKSMMDMMMRGATAMRPGTMVMIHGDKMYMIPNRKMANGKMLADEIMRTMQ